MQLQMLITSQLYQFLPMIPNAMKDAECGWKSENTSLDGGKHIIEHLID